MEELRYNVLERKFIEYEDTIPEHGLEAVMRCDPLTVITNHLPV